MSVPEHLWRFPTRAAIDSLAKRFGLPNEPGMQDWEYEVADPDRLDEFIDAYDNGGLSDDERFTLMETILESFDELLGASGVLDPRWEQNLARLDRNIGLHAHSVWYWSCVGRDDPEEQFRITTSVRRIFDKHRDRLQTPSKD